MKRSNLIALLATALGSVILFTCSLFAWYTNIKSSSDISFDILQIDSLVTMYQANDDNFNGIPNLLTTGNEDKYYNPQIVDGSAVGYVAYSNMYHHEKYSFNYWSFSFKKKVNSVLFIFLFNYVFLLFVCYEILFW